MLGHDASNRSKLYKTMTEQQFDEVISAIIDGKYSWACMLILEFAGYNPLYYIPRRTYDRLKKENRRHDIERNAEQFGGKLHSENREDKVTGFPSAESRATRSYQTEIRDLTYLEQADSEIQKAQGRGLDGISREPMDFEVEPNKLKVLYLKMSNWVSL
jgi:hypothetical protein